MTYLAYHISDYNEGKELPLAAGATKDEALALGIRTVLQLGWTDGSLSVHHNPDVTPEDAAAINEAVQGFLTKN